MEDFEFLRNITIGQYLPADSFLHRMDPRAKLVAFIFLVAGITFTVSYTGNVIWVLAVLGLLWLSRIPVGYGLRGLKPAAPFIAILFVLQILFYGESFARGSRVLYQLGPLPITDQAVQLAVVSTLRFVELFILISILTFSTTTTALTHGTERLGAPFRRFGWPAHEVALILTIALRFVPTIAETAERIMKAQASRGADFGSRGRLRFVQTTRNMLPLLVPLFLDSLRRAEDLILAMEARGYVSGAGRTKFVMLHSRPADWLAVLAAGGFAAWMLLYVRYLP